MGSVRKLVRSLTGGLLAAFVVLAEAPAVAQDEASVSAETAARIEAEVVLPDGARPLDGYARYYYPELGKVIGYYIGAGDGPPLDLDPGVFLTMPPIEIDDGGCGVVTVIFDPVADRVESVACNGEA